MTRFKLICDHSCDLDTHVVTHEFNAEYLPDVIMNIEQFLRGAGYIFDGELTITSPHTEQYYDTERNR